MLHALASVGLPDAAELIVEVISRGAEVDQLDTDAYTPLARAVIAGSISSTLRTGERRAGAGAR